MKIHRRIYEQHNGYIPIDEDGRTYEIHHKDGNHTNNDPSNLMAITLQEHYDIHYKQGDYGACFRMAQRMNISPKEKSELAIKANKKRVENGTHNFLGGEISRRVQRKRIENGTYHFLGGEIQRRTGLRRSKEGTNPFLGGEIQRRTQMKLIEDGIHPFLDSEIQKQRAIKRNKRLIEEGCHHSQREYICPYCNKSGKGHGMYRWHFDNCKSKGI